MNTELRLNFARGETYSNLTTFVADTLPNDGSSVTFDECRAAWLGLTVREYRALEAGDDPLLAGRVWERMVEVFQWPRASR